MTNREFFRSKQLFAVVGVALAAIVAAVMVELLIKGPNPLPKFISYFDRPGVVRVDYKVPKKSRYSEWVDYSKRKEKRYQVDGGFTTLEIWSPKVFQTYDQEAEGMSKSRSTRSNQLQLLRAVEDAKKGDLNEVFRSGGIVYYVFARKRKQSQEPEDLHNLLIGIDEKTSLLARIGVVEHEDEDGEKVPGGANEVRSIKRLPASKSRSIFTARELKKRNLIGESKFRSIGFSRSDLKKFKAFQPYWLGEEIEGAKVETIVTNKVSGEDNLSFNYTKDGVSTFELYEVADDSKKSKSLWKYLNYDKRIKINGSPALLVDEGQPTLYIKRGGTTLWIKGLKYKYSQRNEFIKLVEKNLQRP